MIGLQFVFAVLMYFGTFFSYYLPIRIFSKTVNNRLENDLNNQLKLSKLDFNQEEKQRRIYSNLNCFACGIFLAMSFLSIPMIRSEFDKFLKEINLTDFNYPLSELTILLGLFLVLFLEQLIVKFRTNSTPFLHLDEEEPNDDDQSKESLLNESILIDQSQETQDAELDNHLESINELSNDISTDVLNAFKTKNQIDKKKFVTFSTSPHNHQHHNHVHHSHHHSHHHFDLNSFNDELNLSFFMLIFASSIHSVFEGLALGLISQYNKAINLFLGIFIHECIIAVALGINAAKVNKGIMFGLLFSFTIPIGKL